ncbi:MAG: hypothetical protein HHAS10_02510 [Candidatus Altimarinota bacterium]
MEDIKKEFQKINFWSWIRILIVVLLFVGAYSWGVIDGSRYYPNPQNTQGKYGRPMRGEFQKQYENKYFNQAMNHDSMTMNDMVKMLEGKTGDDLDKAFLIAMIPHHQGAIDMAKYLTGAKHDELKKLGADIIAAQANEIDQMEKWLREWGYTNSGTISSGTSIDPQDEMMREHCREMPTMLGCEKYY